MTVTNPANTPQPDDSDYSRALLLVVLCYALFQGILVCSHFI